MKKEIIVAIIAGFALIIATVITKYASTPNEKNRTSIDTIKNNSINDIEVEGNYNSIIQGSTNTINFDTTKVKKSKK